MEGDGSSWLLRTKLSSTIRKSNSCRESYMLLFSAESKDVRNLDPVASPPTSASSPCSSSYKHRDRTLEVKMKKSSSGCSDSMKAKPGVDTRKFAGSGHYQPILRKRSSSPMPTITLSDVFKEAKAIRKRSSTPPPTRSSLRDSSPLKYYYLSSKKNEEEEEEEEEEEWMVDLSKLYLGLRFASGAHSRLYHGMYKEQPVAVKVIRQPNDDDDDDDINGVMAARLEKQFTREATFLSHLSHRNVIKLAGACRKPPVFCIITEYLSGGSLRAFLRKLDHEPLPLEETVGIGLQIARGLEYIHSQGIVHRDLKPENILFDKDHLCAKVADFGIASEEAHCDVVAAEEEEEPGTYRWMAPEMINHKPCGRKVDVYSFGLILWEMVTGTIPYEGMSPIQAAFAVVNKNLRPEIPADCPEALRTLIEQCWALLPENRPEFCRIVKVLEHFESSLIREGILDQLQNLTCPQNLFAKSDPKA